MYGNLQQTPQCTTDVDNSILFLDGTAEFELLEKTVGVDLYRLDDVLAACPHLLANKLRHVFITVDALEYPHQSDFLNLYGCHNFLKEQQE